MLDLGSLEPEMAHLVLAFCKLRYSLTLKPSKLAEYFATALRNTELFESEFLNEAFSAITSALKV